MNFKMSEYTLQKTWECVLGIPWDIDRLASGLIFDGGVDAEGLTAQDFVHAIENSGNPPWEKIGWTCDEMLACYIGYSLSDEELVRSIAAVVLARKAARLGFGDWEFSARKVFQLLCINRERIDVECYIFILQSVVC